MQGGGPQRVLIDANVWYSRTLRDWLGILSTRDRPAPFSVHWTEDILAELIYHLRKQHLLWDGQRIVQIRDRITETFSDGRVDRYPDQPAYLGPDDGDRHVHAAAIACQAHVLVTFNARDFPGEPPYRPYEVMDPDDFLCVVDDEAPHLVAESAVAMARYWIGRDGHADLPKRLREARCPTFAARVGTHLFRNQTSLTERPPAAE